VNATGGGVGRRGAVAGAVVDWLSFTFTEWDSKGLVPMVRNWLASWSGGEPIVGEGGNGLHGYSHSVMLYSVVNHQPVVIGVVAWGGNNGTAYLSLNGTYCGMVCYWDLVANTLEAIKAKLTRVDVAVDAMDGEFSVEDACEWYRENGFTGNGRRPSHSTEGDWLDGDAPRGRTLYVGKREHGKYARIYEKGKQLGNPDSDWTRFEVEVKNRDRVIPYDILRRPAEYFAGTYPCAAPLVDVGAERIRTTRAEGEISLSRMRAYCKSAYGRLVHVLRLVTPDHVELLESLAIVGVPRRLEKSALLQHHHADTRSGPPLGDADGHVRQTASC
jgi:phage replication initiation protein